MVKILYFAKLREDLGRNAEELELPVDIATVAALRSHLVARGGAWAASLAQGRALRVAVNHDMADAATPIKSGDEVAFFPPVTGG
jgi:molybdopterin synthase sulfur carrier subunit